METTQNQPPPLVDINLFTTDEALVQALQREGAAWSLEVATAFGRLAGSSEVR